MMHGARQLKMRLKNGVVSDGSFEGLLAVYNNVDLGGDLIEPGAFTKTIKDHGNEIPLLWQHKTDEPIGMLTLTDGPAALSVKGQLLMESPVAKSAYLLMKANIVRGLSIGFDTVKDAMDGAVRHLKEIRLWEGSIVTFPMNPAAMVTTIKQRYHAHEMAVLARAAEDKSRAPAFHKSNLVAIDDPAASRMIESIRSMIPRA